MIEELMCSLCGEIEEMDVMERAVMEYEKFVSRARPAVKTKLHIMLCRKCKPDVFRLLERGPGEGSAARSGRRQKI